VLSDDVRDVVVRRTYKRGSLWVDPAPGSHMPRTITRKFACTPPSADAIRIRGSGTARVIGLVPNQIITESLLYEIDAGNIPDTDRDILKTVVCSRYRDHRTGVGLVHGFGITEGAIAASISHDSHNIVATGASDDAILRAIALVIQNNGGMAAVSGEGATVLPLACAGLMSVQPYEDVVDALDRLAAHGERMGAIRDPFMYLSFLALTVIPALRITDRGLFDAAAFRDTELWTR
jgi:adenine deaminase